MENKTLEKTLDMAGSAMKLAANLSEKKEEPKPAPIHQSDDNSNKATTGTQSVNVVLDSGKKKEPKPIEKHIHEFPENRPLTSEECELALKKAQMDYDLSLTKQRYEERCYDREWQYRMEQDKKNERKGWIKRVIGGILIAIGAGSVGYSIYADYKSNKASAAQPKALPESIPVKTEGEVK